MEKKLPRRPRGYDGIGLTSRCLHELLPKVLKNMGQKYKERGDLILASWPEIIGSKLAVMTKAIAFENGVLHVQVHNSTLYTLLSQHDKAKILKSIRDKFPKTPIKNVLFRMR